MVFGTGLCLEVEFSGLVVRMGDGFWVLVILKVFFFFGIWIDRGDFYIFILLWF